MPDLTRGFPVTGEVLEEKVKHQTKDLAEIGSLYPSMLQFN